MRQKGYNYRGRRKGKRACVTKIGKARKWRRTGRIKRFREIMGRRKKQEGEKE